MKLYFISLGCDKNLVDSEMMLGQLVEHGIELTDDIEEAQAVVINSCCFIGDAKEESIQNILDMAQRKKSGQLKAIVVGGCLAQRYQEEIRKEIPEVDAIIGTMNIDRIVEALDQALQGETGNYVGDCNAVPVFGKKRYVTTGGHYAYMKIAEGCNKRCTYCIIPYVRGSFRSIPMESLLAEANTLAEQGVKELILVAQETTLYGVDLYGEKSLHKLLLELAKIPGIKWIRVLYCYPEEIYDDLIETIATEPKVCHYLDLPIQHASDEILRRMGRRTNQQDLREIIGKLRSRIPDICLRTTLISGFPGETQEDFEELYRFVNEMEFDRLGVFTYSAEEGTPAAEMPDQIPEEVKESRRDELMELQQEIAFEKAGERVGKTFEVLVEGSLPEEGTFVGRTYMDAPEVDGFVFFEPRPEEATREYMTGEIEYVTITEAREYDLYGEVTEQ
ncbi:MAG: 30S ribosomal protein S12 methylthiotransferase RimO [Lachnospiraceae bacterium]|nr:30S ribosomal protein S12 methylthiotransferase RimO [Lachnospiraceae bacterium]